MDTGMRSNQIIRDLIGKELTKYPVGKNFTTGDMAADITTRRTPTDSRSIGRLLRERDDVIRVKSGIWQRKATA